MSKKRYFAYRSFWPELETMKKFRELAGVDTFNVMISNTANSLGFPYTKYPPVWKWNGIFDLDAFDKVLDDVLAEIPDAKFMCMLDLNTPHWWTRYLGAFGVRYDSFYELGKISGSKLWRKDTSDYLQLVLTHAEEKYGDRIAAYILGCGGATEWHDRSRYEESIYRLVSYREWQKARGEEPTDIPSRIQRDQGRVDFEGGYTDPGSYYNGNDPTGGAYDTLYPEGPGLLREPYRDAGVINYIQFCNEFNADTVAFFLHKAREIIPAEKELGVFFGYSFDNWALSAGHLSYEKLYNDPALDFVTAPICNYKIGRGSFPATTEATIRLAGKRMLDEMDQKTLCMNRRMTDFYEMPSPAGREKVDWDSDADGRNMAKSFTFGCGNGWNTPEAVAAGIKRDFANCLIRGNSMWWFDMWGGFYQGKIVFVALRRCKEIWDAESTFEPLSEAEALFVKDPENLFLLNDLNQRCGTFENIPLRNTDAAGVPYDKCSFNDLEKMDLSRIKFAVICHPFHLPEKKMTVLKKTLLNSNRVILWCYGTCFNQEGKYDPDYSERITGIPFRTPGVTTRQMNGWISAYAYRMEKTTPEDFRKLLLLAKCHFYTDKSRPVTANQRLLSLHTPEAETLHVRLREEYSVVTELFSGEVWHKTDCLKLTSQGPASWLLRLEK
ncbi:MAG: hypothetical protein IJH79_02185 [Lentisphaeria bacterium]|nr:hypothetical protein [Lentisphaeria bacterium]